MSPKNTKTFCIKSTSHDYGKDNSPLYIGTLHTHLKPLNTCDDTISSNILPFSTHVKSDISETKGINDYNSLDPLANTFISKGKTFSPNSEDIISLYPPKMDENVVTNGAYLPSMEPILNTIAEFSASETPFISDGFIDMMKLNPNAEPFCLPIMYHEYGDIDGDKDSPYSILQNLRVKNVDKIIIGHININSIRHKFEMLADLIIDRIDILLISETKIDNTFTKSQFNIKGYTSPLWFNRTTK